MSYKLIIFHNNPKELDSIISTYCSISATTDNRITPSDILRVLCFDVRVSNIRERVIDKIKGIKECLYMDYADISEIPEFKAYAKLHALTKTSMSPIIYQKKSKFKFINTGFSNEFFKDIDS
jgi:hypothetical protein